MHWIRHGAKNGSGNLLWADLGYMSASRLHGNSMKPKKYISPPMRILVSGMHQPATRMGWRKPTVRPMADKSTGSILIGFERAG